MAELFATGRVVDLILALMVLEALVLGVLWRRAARGVPPLSLIVNLAAGACLLLALRAALTDAGALITGGFLALALVAHLADLALHWQRGRRG
jgi:hypothetical protein